MQKGFPLLTASLLFSVITETHAQPVGMGLHSWPKEKESGISVDLMRNCCEKVEKDKRRIFYLNTRVFRMSMQIKGIYVRDGMMFFRLKLANHSHLDYDVDSIRFFITDMRQSKKGLTRLNMLSPLYNYRDTRTIAGKSKQDNVIVLPRFTLPLGKILLIEASEKNGGRRLQLRADNFTLLRSRLI